jgi:archaellum component FlaC
MAEQSGQLDQISEAIGEIRGTVGGIERYIHQERHGLRNLSQEVKSLSSQVSREIATAKAEINASMTTALERVEARIATIDERVTILERIRDREYGARGLALWFLQSPLIGWLAAAIVIFAAWWKKP